ncbi:MAG: transcription-repair coupling factor, partial [bacterium]
MPISVLNSFISLIKKSPQFVTIRKNIIQGIKKQSICGLYGSAKAYFLAALKNEVNRPFLIILPGQTEAERFYTDLQAFSEKEILFFPDLEILPVDEIPPHKELVGQRLAVLDRLLSAKSEDVIIVSPIRAILYKTFSPNSLQQTKISIQTSISLDILLDNLIQHGYLRDEMVETKGTFSHRGGIVDVYPVHADLPVRIEFFGDEIESIRQFDTITQRSVAFIDQVTILPVQENIKENDGTIFDYLPESSLVVLDDPAYLQNEANRLKNVGKFNIQDLTQPIVTFEDGGEFEFFTRPILEFKNNIALFIDEYKNWQEEGNQIVVIAGYKGQEMRIKELLKDENLIITSADIKQGFQFREIQLVLVTDKEIFGYQAPIQQRRFDHSDTLPISTFTDLKIGDYVVHSNFGIGRYAGITTLKVEGVKKDLLLIEYAEGDKLYIPLDQFGLVNKYIGDKDRPPKIYRLADPTWTRVKNKVKKSLESIAKELIELYAARKALPGFAFSKDTDWQYEFEEGFIYEETPDQLKAISDIKKDMENPQPMDRLICGDVGYGKTEVALRGAFKAVLNSKQVAVLVPTTILAFQHYNTFVQRLAPFPIKVEMLSRFKTKAQQRKIIEGLKNGQVDICIGTHRLLQKDIAFHNLGLLVIDEEQRFGVKHKEKLKTLRKLVDVLTLTATPIPRTLYMSLSGARDMSIINTPPPERLPIKTFILPFNKQVIREAVLREMERGGQIYFVHTEVKTILRLSLSLTQIVPEARIAIAHGQMHEHELENIMLEFLNHKYDVLLSTSIIESGIDIPTVNTIIINNAHQFGLAQLYQLRGRVGRSKHMAYAYLFYPTEFMVSEMAKERLEAIREFSDLGSGFKVAMRDLEIRGAGNILGPEQH